jgi:hypothetical protein
LRCATTPLKVRKHCAVVEHGSGDRESQRLLQGYAGG